MPFIHVYNWKLLFKVHDYVLLGSCPEFPCWKRYSQKTSGYVTAFTLESVPKENWQWFWSWRSVYFYDTDRYFIVYTSLIKIQRPYDFYNITWTNFKSRQSFLSFKTYISWGRTAVVYYRTLLTKVIIKQMCFYKKIRDKMITYLLTTEVLVES